MHRGVGVRHEGERRRRVLCRGTRTILGAVQFILVLPPEEETVSITHGPSRHGAPTCAFPRCSAATCGVPNAVAHYTPQAHSRTSSSASSSNPCPSPRALLLVPPTDNLPTAPHSATHPHLLPRSAPRCIPAGHIQGPICRSLRQLLLGLSRAARSRDRGLLQRPPACPAEHHTPSASAAPPEPWPTRSTAIRTSKRSSRRGR